MGIDRDGVNPRCIRAGRIDERAAASAGRAAEETGRNESPAAGRGSRDLQDRRYDRAAMSPTLMRAVADLAVFLAGSDDQTVDPDAALRELEALSGHLRELSDADREAFIMYVTGTLAPESHAAGDIERETILRNLPSDLALID